MTPPGVGTGGHFNVDRNNSFPGRNMCRRVKRSAVSRAGTRGKPRSQQGPKHIQQTGQQEKGTDHLCEYRLVFFNQDHHVISSAQTETDHF